MSLIKEYLFVVYYSDLAIIAEQTTDLTAAFFKANIYNFDGQARNEGWKFSVKRKLIRLRINSHE